MSNRVITKITDTTSFFIVKNFFSLYIDMADMSWKLITTSGTFHGDKMNINSRSISFYDELSTFGTRTISNGTTSFLKEITSHEMQSRFTFTVSLRNKYYVDDMIKRFKQCETDKMIHLASKTYDKFIGFMLAMKSELYDTAPFSIIKGEIVIINENDIEFKIDSPKLKYMSKILNINYYNPNHEISLQMEDGNTVLIRYGRGEYPRKIYNVVHCNTRRMLGRNDFHIFKHLINNVKTGRIV